MRAVGAVAFANRQRRFADDAEAKVRAAVDTVNFNFKLKLMNAVTMLEFRSHTDRILRRIRKGERLILTHRGRPVARLEPPLPARRRYPPDDPIFHLDDFCFDGPRGKLKNSEIDRIVYGA